MEKSMQITKSQRGADKIIYDGHSYRKDKARGNWVTWRCDVTGCHGRAKTQLNYMELEGKIEAFKKEESCQRGVYSSVNMGSTPYHSKKKI